MMDELLNGEMMDDWVDNGWMDRQMGAWMDDRWMNGKMTNVWCVWMTQ